MRTLVVEDDPIARIRLARVLYLRGHDVTDVEDAESALQAMQNMAFPLILVDWMLPKMDGLELCRRVRQLPNGDEPVIILVTSQDKSKYIIQALDAGANDYLTKPIDPTILNTRLTIAERMVVERAKRQVAEDALQSSEASFRALTEKSPDGIIVHRNGRIVYLNPAAMASLGYTQRDELIGRNYIELLHPEERADTLKRIREMLESGEATPAREERFLRRDEGTSTLETVSIPLEFDGEPSVVALSRDLTERKHMESQLIQADRMVSVGTLAAGIAHEINNPLTYVITTLHLIQEEIEELEQEFDPQRIDEIKESLVQAKDGSERVRLIVRELRGFSRVDEQELGPVKVIDVLESAISMAWNEIRHKAQLQRDFQDIPSVIGNKSKLGQVFLNLLVNAAQALPDRKTSENTIRVSTYLNDSQEVVVEVTDNGMGIKESVRKRIFDPFFTTKPIGVGTGLGLSICHNIISSFDGEITVQSVENQGTTMRVILQPSTQPSVIPEAIVTESENKEKPIMRILIVDDEPGVARSLRRALQNHDVTVSLSGRDAMKKLAEGPPFDIIFCDLMMPDISGIDLYNETAKNSPGTEKRFVFITGGAFTPQSRNFLESIPNPWFEKPFDIHHVQNLVKQHAST